MLWPRHAGGGGIGTGHAVGLDFSKEAVELARSLVPNGRFRQGDAQVLPFRAAIFDAVFCGYSLIHLPRVMLRVLRPSGRVAVSVWDAVGAGLTLSLGGGSRPRQYGRGPATRI